MIKTQSTKRWRFGWPRSMAAQLMLLLAVAMIVANAVALIVLGIERGRALRDVQRNAQLARVADLVAALQQVDRARRSALVRDARRQGVRLRLSPRPLYAEQRLMESQIGEDEMQLARRFADIAGVTVDDIRAKPRGPRRFDAAVRLNDGQWLNVRLSRPPPLGKAAGVIFIAGLGISLLTVLLAAFFFMRRITRPLGALTNAMERAGTGDRDIRAPVKGTLETRAAATTFNAMQDSIAAFDAERARTAAAVGHDLRTPITSLRIRAEMLDDEAMREPMIATLDDMRVMADGLLAWGRTEGEQENAVEVDLAIVLRDILSTHANVTNITLDAPQSVTVRGRPVALRRAIGNLVDNALRHGGSAELRLVREMGCAVVTVTDRGPGLPDDMLESVFEPFTRGDTARTPQAAGEDGGSGLGLSIARTIIRAHGGTLVLANRDGGGMVARVELPL